MYLILLISCIGTWSQSQWQEITDLNGRFKVSCPGYMDEKIDSISTGLGTITYHTFFYQNNEGNKRTNPMYMVSYCDYPEAIIFADSVGLADEFFASTMEAAAETVNGEIMYDSDIELDGFPGKLWRIDFGDAESIIKTRAYLVGSRYYAIQTISVKEKSPSSELDRFFDSFKFL